eukprot:1138036-Pelagomonas_calceolata.AAC.8
MVGHRAAAHSTLHISVGMGLSEQVGLGHQAQPTWQDIQGMDQELHALVRSNCLGGFYKGLGWWHKETECSR